MNRRKVYSEAHITKSKLVSVFVSIIRSSKPGVTITFREIDRLEP